MKEAERCVLIIEKAPVIRGALSVLLAEVKSKNSLTPGTLETLEGFARQGCDKLILDLRNAKESLGGIAPGVRNLRISHIGQVLVVSAEVTEPGILQKIKDIHRAHHFPAHLASGLRFFVHLLF